MDTTGPSTLLQLLTKREAAVVARCSVRTVERALAGGDLRAGGTPGRRLILLDELRRWLNVDDVELELGDGLGEAVPVNGADARRGGRETR